MHVLVIGLGPEAEKAVAEARACVNDEVTFIRAAPEGGSAQPCVPTFAPTLAGPVNVEHETVAPRAHGDGLPGQAVWVTSRGHEVSHRCFDAARVV